MFDLCVCVCVCVCVFVIMYTQHEYHVLFNQRLYEEEDDYEKMYPAQLSALHLGSSLNAQSSFNEPSNTSSTKTLTSPASMSAYSHSTRTYDPQDCINRQTSNGMNAYKDTSSSGVQKGSIETHQVHVLNRLRGTESSGQEASISNRAETNAQKSELENRVAGVLSKRDASSDSLVKPSKRKAPGKQKQL